MQGFDRLAESIGAELKAASFVPLLVVRVPACQRTTVLALAGTPGHILRRDDLCAHDRGSERFAVAMLSRTRTGCANEPRHARAALARIGTALSRATGRRFETGWCPIESRPQRRQLPKIFAAALERSVRERRHAAALATVGHQLRTPLTAIRGYLDSLLDGDLDPATERRFLETARRETLRLARFVDGMLEFSMLDFSTRGCGAPCDVAEQVRVAIDATGPLAREGGIAIRARLERAAPARIDADACAHALVNVVENAVKYGAGRIDVACESAGGLTRVIIDDDGPGVPAAERERIFELGVRGALARGGGSGIGLAVVKAVVERAGGHVCVGDSPLGGARFVLAFPSL